MESEKLITGLKELLQNDDTALAVAAKVEELAAIPSGAPNEKAKAAADWAEKEYPDATKNKKTKLRELVYACLPAEPADVTSGPPSVADKPVSAPKADTIKVKVCAKMAEDGGQFYDIGQKEGSRHIGKEPVGVEKTIFILQKLGNQELIEVK